MNIQVGQCVVVRDFVDGMKSAAVVGEADIRGFLIVKGTNPHERYVTPGTLCLVLETDGYPMHGDFVRVLVSDGRQMWLRERWVSRH